MLHDITSAVLVTLRAYLPAWIVGVLLALLMSMLSWFFGRRISRIIYVILAGVSFIPVTILLPYFLRTFGLRFFVYPLLALPVALVMFASFHEAFGHSNRVRLSLMKNYGMSRRMFFRRILLRESLPSIHTSLRFTLSLSFAIFLALDYFIESWGGLGCLVRYYYNRLSFDYTLNNYLMAITVLCAGLVGSIQVVLLSLLMKPLTEYRKHF